MVEKKIDSISTSATTNLDADFQFKKLKDGEPEPSTVEPDKSTAKTVDLPATTQDASMSEAAKRRAEMQARREARQKELEQIKIGMLSRRRGLFSYKFTKILKLWSA